MMATCSFCGAEIEDPADVCERHALTHEQAAEMMKRVQEAQLDYYLEIWPELREEA